MKISQVKTEDAAELLALYAPYVEHTAVSFENEVPDIAEFVRRIEATTAKFPYLKAEIDGEIVGYAYANSFRTRAAYNHSVETTIYVRSDMRRQNIGRSLYNALAERLASMGITNMYACIAYPETDDPYLTKDSFLFHERVGFELVGTFRSCASKFGRWYTMVWMEKVIAPHNPDPEDVKFGEY